MITYEARCPACSQLFEATSSAGAISGYLEHCKKNKDHLSTLLDIREHGTFSDGELVDEWVEVYLGRGNAPRNGIYSGASVA